MAQSFSVGSAAVEITPSKPAYLAGYYYDRLSTAIHDPLLARCLAVSDGKTTVALCVGDIIDLPRNAVEQTRRLVQQRCGLPPECLILSAIHTHTAPDPDRETEYTAGLPELLAQGVSRAVTGLVPQEIRTGRAEENTLQYIRRFRMRDGSVRTNPGIGNPEVVLPIGAVDPSVSVVLAGQGGKISGGLVHFGLHCDTVGGTEISADWTHYLRQAVVQGLGGKPVLLTPIGTCGDVNHWNVFRNVSLRGFAETERIGTKVAQAALEAAGRATVVEPGRVMGLRQEITASIRVPSEAELAAAKTLMATPPPDGVDFTMDRVIAGRQVAAAAIGPTLKTEITVLTFGSVAIVGVPTEYFTALGRQIKNRSPFPQTIIVTLANGNVGYVGERHNYEEEGGYEMTSAPTCPGTGELIADTAVDLLRRAG
ncbi:MAG: hypothetical protein WDA75_12070 [Candidatus Latescibacterota bacterium]|jgi:hypothetical protein